LKVPSGSSRSGTSQPRGSQRAVQGNACRENMGRAGSACFAGCLVVAVPPRILRTGCPRGERGGQAGPPHPGDEPGGGGSVCQRRPNFTRRRQCSRSW
jgi:hypothetical protein